MLKIQEQTLQTLNHLQSIISDPNGGPQRVLGADLVQHVDRLSSTTEIIKQQELLVPVIGSFSAGKSTLLNALMGSRHLPVAITPETSLPAELRYAEKEYILAYTTEGKEEHHTITAIPEIQRNAENYVLLRLYLNCPRLKALAPLVLVDMPGFNAPLDQHNKAINQYIGRGVHYLLVVGVDEGGLHKHGLNSLHNIASLGRSFSIALNKTDLRPDGEVQKVVEYITQQLADEGFASSITPVHQGDTTKIQQVLSALDAEALMRQAIHLPLLDLQAPLRTTLENALQSGQRSLDENKRVLAELEQNIAALEQSQAQRLESVRQFSVSDRSQRVLNEVEKALSNSSQSLALLAKRDDGQLQSTVLRLVEGTMIQALSAQTTDIEGTLFEEFQNINCGSLHVNIELDEDWLQLAAGHIQTILPGLLGGAAASGFIGTAADLALKATSVVGKVVPNPLTFVATTVIPFAMQKLFKIRKDARIAEAIREQMIPGILVQIRPQVDQTLTEFYRKAWSTLNNTINAELQSRKAALQEALRQHDVAAEKRVMTELQKAVEATKQLITA